MITWTPASQPPPPPPPTPTLSITGNGTNPTSATTGQNITVAATFTPGTGDTLTDSAINDNNNNLWCGTGNTCSQAMWTASPIGSKSYTFTPTTAGTYIFYPAVETNAHPVWNNYSQSLTITVTAPPPVIPPTCTLLPASQSVTQGSSPTLNYTITGTATSAQINSVSVSDTTGSHSGYQPAPPANNTEYFLVVSNSGGQNTCGPASVTVSGVPGAISSPLTADPARVPKGGSTSLSWTTSHMLACSLSENGSMLNGNVALSSTGYSVGPITAQTVFSLSCNDGSDPAVTSSASVDVVPVYQEL
jgi:hypothetical protein